MLSRIERAQTQPIYILDNNNDELKYTVVGSTTNLYTVSLITDTCDCPDFVRRQLPCKHIIFVWLNKFGISPDEIEENYIIGFEEDYLRSLVYSYSCDSNQDKKKKEQKEGEVKQRFFEGLECAICYEEMGVKDSLVYCRTTCGNSIHRACFEKMREVMKRGTCPYCRSKML